MSSKTNRSPWTPDEQEVLLQHIRETPNNLSYAFDMASQALKNRRPSAVSRHWYEVLRKDKNTGAIFGMISPHGAVANTKNMVRPQKKGESWTMDIASLAVSKLNKQQRMELIDKIMQMK
jgi:hypothetical protein